MTEEMTHHLEKGTRNEKFATCAMSGPHHPLEYRVAGVHRQVRYYQQSFVLCFGIFISILHPDFLIFTHKPISLVVSFLVGILSVLQQINYNFEHCILKIGIKVLSVNQSKVSYFYYFEEFVEQFKLRWQKNFSMIVIFAF